MTLRRPYTYAEHIRRVRTHPCFREQLRRAHDDLINDDRRGESWCNFGPGQLAEHGSDRREVTRLIGRLLDPRHSPAAAVVGPSFRSALWVLALSPELPLPLPAARGDLQPAQGEELWRLCEKRLRGDPLHAAERQRLRRLLARIDPESPIRVTARLALEARTRWNLKSGRREIPTRELVPGAAVALSATSLGAGALGEAQPSWASYPVLGRAVAIGQEEVVVELSPPHFGFTPDV